MATTTNIKKLIEILSIANEIGHEVIAKETVISLAREFDVNIPKVSFPKSLEDVRLYTPLAIGNRITLIKELRERAMEAGLEYGLKEAKEEVDSRLKINQNW